METDLVTLKDASRICCVSLATMNRWVRGTGMRLSRAAGEKWIKRSQVAGVLRGRDLPVPFELESWPRILIVEDEDDLRVLIERHMRNWWSGIEVRTTSDGLKAVEILADYRPDLAIVDVNLPGKDGLSLCHEVTHEPELAHTKVLIMTGSREQGVNANAFSEGAGEFMSKPFDPAALRAAAQRLLGSRVR